MLVPSDLPSPSSQVPAVVTSADGGNGSDIGIGVDSSVTVAPASGPTSVSAGGGVGVGATASETAEPAPEILATADASTTGTAVVAGQLHEVHEANPEEVAAQPGGSNITDAAGGSTSEDSSSAVEAPAPKVATADK
jgi:hypothetical protein